MFRVLGTLTVDPSTAGRRKAGGYYLSQEELREAIQESYPLSLKIASLEAFEERLDEKTPVRKADEEKIKAEALELILEAQNRR